jgi:hypothetical protein
VQALSLVARIASLIRFAGRREEQQPELAVKSLGFNSDTWGIAHASRDAR